MDQNLLTNALNGGNVILQVSADDLRNAMAQFYHDERERTEQAIKAHREKANLSRGEAAKILGVSFATLWHWAKSGYLVPVKIGTKVLYKATDIDKLLTEKYG